MASQLLNRHLPFESCRHLSNADPGRYKELFFFIPARLSVEFSQYLIWSLDVETLYPYIEADAPLY
jgi:hypothetical protein